MYVIVNLNMPGFASSESPLMPTVMNWQNMVGLYLWGMGINGTASIGSVDAPLDLDINIKDDLLDNLGGSFSAHYEGGKGRWGLLADYMFADLDPRTEMQMVLKLMLMPVTDIKKLTRVLTILIIGSLKGCGLWDVRAVY